MRTGLNCCHHHQQQLQQQQLLLLLLLLLLHVSIDNFGETSRPKFCIHLSFLYLRIKCYYYSAHISDVGWLSGIWHALLPWRRSFGYPWWRKVVNYSWIFNWISFLDEGITWDSLIRIMFFPYRIQDCNSKPYFIIKKRGRVVGMALTVTPFITLKRDTKGIYLTVNWHFVSVSKSPEF